MSKNSRNQAAKVDFKTTQQRFSAYIRDPINNPAPKDVKKQRIDTYRELFFNNVEGFLSSNFPVLKKILNDSQWNELAQDFFAHHQCKSPYFSEIPEEFIEFLQNERDNPNDYPFMLELVHYEWIEMALSISKESLPPLIEYQSDLSELCISLSPLALSLAYEYPVQLISPDNLPTEKSEQATYLIVYRDWDDEVLFIQTNPITFALLQILEASPNISVESLLMQLAKEMQLPEPETIMPHGLEIIQNLIQKSIIVY